LAVLFLAGIVACPVSGDVVAVGDNGFQVRIVRQASPAPQQVYDSVIHKIGSWWSSDHTWSGDATNLSIDLRRAAMVEALSDGGFCRHMEVVFHQPGGTLRMTGGLGPLQEMGLNGALTIKTTAKDDKTEIELTYNVSGFSPGGFEQIAPLVDGVLTEQVDRLVRYCETGSADAIDADANPMGWWMSLSSCRAASASLTWKAKAVTSRFATKAKRCLWTGSELMTSVTRTTRKDCAIASARQR
jgi:hypothetical protein